MAGEVQPTICRPNLLYLLYLFVGLVSVEENQGVYADMTLPMWPGPLDLRSDDGLPRVSICIYTQTTRRTCSLYHAIQYIATEAAYWLYRRTNCNSHAWTSRRAELELGIVG